MLPDRKGDCRYSLWEDRRDGARLVGRFPKRMDADAFRDFHVQAAVAVLLAEWAKENHVKIDQRNN